MRYKIIFSLSVVRRVGVICSLKKRKNSVVAPQTDQFMLIFENLKAIEQINHLMRGRHHPHRDICNTTGAGYAKTIAAKLAMGN